MTQSTVAVSPRYLAASGREEHRAVVASLAKTAAWTVKQTEFALAAASPCRHVSVLVDDAATSDDPHLTVTARTSPRKPPRWTAVAGGDLPREFLTTMTTALTERLLRDPDYVLYGLPTDGELFPLLDPDRSLWDRRTDRDVVEWQTRGSGSRTFAVLRSSDSTAPYLAGGEETLMMAAAVLPTARRSSELLWWAAFTHKTPPFVIGGFLNNLLSPEPATRLADERIRADLLPFIAVSRPGSEPTPTVPLPAPPVQHPGMRPGQGGH
jgi:hypothetical protein